MTISSGFRTTLRHLLSGAVVSVVFSAGWIAQGWRKDRIIFDIQAVAAKADEAAALALVDETNRVRQEEADMRLALQTRNLSLIQERDHAQADRDTFIAGVRSGAIRLSVPIAATAKNTLAADAAAAGGSGNEARTELDPAFAERLTAIADDGDNAIRQLNACIDIYNAVREKLNVQAQKSQPAFDESGSRPDAQPSKSAPLH